MHALNASRHSLASSEHTKTDKTPDGDLCNVADGLNIILNFCVIKKPPWIDQDGFKMIKQLQRERRSQHPLQLHKEGCSYSKGCRHCHRIDGIELEAQDPE